ncbi:hypothetical protein VUR80DRAFT_8764 [Thermomyces stellatus]
MVGRSVGRRSGSVLNTTWRSGRALLLPSTSSKKTRLFCDENPIGFTPSETHYLHLSSYSSYAPEATWAGRVSSSMRAVYSQLEVSLELLDWKTDGLLRLGYSKIVPDSGSCSSLMSTVRDSADEASAKGTARLWTSSRHPRPDPVAIRRGLTRVVSKQMRAARLFGTILFLSRRQGALRLGAGFIASVKARRTYTPRCTPHDGLSWTAKKRKKPFESFRSSYTSRETPWPADLPSLPLSSSSRPI